MKIKKFTKLIALPVILGVILAACGGGGGGTSQGSNNNTVKISQMTLSAGQSATLTANTIMLQAIPISMTWTASNMTGDASTPLVINNADCASASYSGPNDRTTLGSGLCVSTLTIPKTLSSGTWKITNMAKSASGSISDSMDITILPLKASGFQIIDSSIPVTAPIGVLTTMSAPFSVNTGYTVSNIKYTWTSDPGNTTPINIIGASNPTPNVTPDTAGIFKANVTITAEVNGTRETVTGSVFLTVPVSGIAETIDIVQAGVPQIVTAGSVVNLVGTVNTSTGNQYAYSWTQIAPTPSLSVVNITNANASTANFIAPSAIGTYGFLLTVKRIKPDGTVVVTSAQTSVVVNSMSTLVFDVFAGDAQSITTNTMAKLTGTATSQTTASGVTYQYTWTQVGTTPATVLISNPNTLTASFNPTEAGTYTFNLAVTATTPSGASTVSSTTQVIASTGGSTSATAFVIAANAGLVQSVSTNAIVSLTGTQTSQGTVNGVTYAYLWTQTGTAPVPVNLSTPTNLVASFTPTVNGTYSFNLTVTATLPDNTTRVASSDTQVVVGGISTGFSVSAGDATVQAINASALLKGTIATQGSFSNAVFVYTWTQVGITPALVAISNSNSLNASFIPTVAGSYTLMMTVTATQNGIATTQSTQTQYLITP